MNENIMSFSKNKPFWCLSHPFRLRLDSLASVLFSAADRKPLRKYLTVSGAHNLFCPRTVG